MIVSFFPSLPFLTPNSFWALNSVNVYSVDSSEFFDPALAGVWIKNEFSVSAFQISPDLKVVFFASPETLHDLVPGSTALSSDLFHLSLQLSHFQSMLSQSQGCTTHEAVVPLYISVNQSYQLACFNDRSSCHFYYKLFSPQICKYHIFLKSSFLSKPFILFFQSKYSCCIILYCHYSFFLNKYF